MVYYIAHIINNVKRQGEYDYYKVPLFNVIQYVGTDYNKAQKAIWDIINSKTKYNRYELLEDSCDDYFQHEYAFEYVPLDKDGKDVKLSKGCYGIYYADIEEYYNNEE